MDGRSEEQQMRCVVFYMNIVENLSSSFQMRLR